MSLDEIELAGELLPASMPRMEYLKVMPLRMRVGSLILDIGSSCSDYVNYLNMSGANAIGIDVRYFDKNMLSEDANETVRILKRSNIGMPGWPEYIRLVQESCRNFEKDFRENPGHYVAGVVGNLPFRDNSFDIVYSINCITNGLDRNYPIFEKGMSEALRVVKPGSGVLLYPWMGEMDARIKNNQRLLADSLRNQGYRLRPERATSAFERLSIVKP